ncbi:MAG: hypothetical protein R3E32_15950 [Chitinophagales bacterium]
MKNWLFILITLFTIPFFNDLQASGEAKITLVSTSSNSGAIIGNEKTALHLHSFNAISADDCEKEITLTGTIEIVDILEASQQLSRQTQFITKKQGQRRSNHSSGGSNTLTNKTPGNDDEYRKYEIEPIVGNTTNFDTKIEDGLIRFGDKYYLIFTFQDLDRCERNGSDVIDLNPQTDIAQTLKLHVDKTKGEVRLVKADNSLGAVVGGINSYFTVQGNNKNSPNVETGSIRLKISSIPTNNNLNNLKSNGG